MNEDNAVKYREIRLDDVDCISRLVRQLGYDTQIESTKTNIARVLDDNAHYMYVATLPDGEVIGYAHISEVKLAYIDYGAEFHELCVDHRFRGMGIGKELIEIGERWSINRGSGFIMLRSNVIREEAHKFYEHMGFNIIKKQYCIYKDLI